MKLKELRKSLGYTQQQVAEYIGVSMQGYSKYERGEREADYETLIKLATFFNVSIDYLIGNDPPANEAEKKRLTKMISHLKTGKTPDKEIIDKFMNMTRDEQTDLLKLLIEKKK